MNRGLYGKLAVNNIKHNRQFYLPYLLTGMLTVAFFYTMLYLNYNPGLDELPFGAVDVKLVLRLGAVIIGFFSVIFLFYTNSGEKMSLLFITFLEWKKGIWQK